MHKLMEYICQELEEIEHKADKDGKLSMQEVQYADTLAHMKKNLLSAEEMWDNSEYSMEGGSYARGGDTRGRMGSYARGGSYEGGSMARGGRSNRSGGRRGGANQYGSYAMEYSEGNEDMVYELRQLMEQAPNEQARKEFQRFIQKMENM